MPEQESPIQEVSEDQKREPVSRQYFGAIGCESRAFWEYQSEIRLFCQLDLCGEIIEAAKRATKEKRNQIVILDLGSGKEGVFGRALDSQFIDTSLEEWKFKKPSDIEIQEREDLNNLQEKLQRMGITINYLGLTDAEKGQQGNILWRIERENYHGLNVAYTATRSQTIARLLKEHFGRSENVVGLAIAMHFFLYLTPRNFEQALRDSVGALRSGGKLLAIDMDPHYLVGRPGISRTYQHPLTEIRERLNFLGGLEPEFEVELFEAGEIAPDKTHATSAVISKKVKLK